MQNIDICGMWYRFSDYEISEVAIPEDLPIHLEGHYRYIRPTSDAQLETFLLSMGSKSEMASGRESVAYEDIRDVDLEDEEAILSWCRRFGLLGILPQRSVQIRLAPRWIENDGLFASQTSYTRAPGIWQVAHTAVKEEKQEHRDVMLGGVADYTKTSHIYPVSMISQLFATNYQETPLGDAIAQYFPDVTPDDKDNNEYPVPLSPEFWSRYGESVGEFRTTILRFREMVDALSNQGPLEQLPEQACADLRQAHSSLQSLTSMSAEVGVGAGGRIVPGLAFNSLLGIFGFSIWQDLADGKLVRHCNRQRCTNVYLTSNTKRRYCSDRCRQAEEKARWRSR